MKIKTLGRYAIDMLRGQELGQAISGAGQGLGNAAAQQQSYIGQQNQNAYNAHINAHQNAVGAINTQGMGGVFYAGNGDTAPPINLEEGAWVAAISELENLWLVKFGSKWVQQHDLDEFYKVAAARLIKANKVETHHLTQISLPVYRIIE
jgi:hypothetical protein